MAVEYILNTLNNLLIINFIEYATHKLAHSKIFGGYLYKYHKIHHYVSFPPNKLMIKKYKEVVTLEQLIIIGYILGLFIPILKIYSYFLPKYTWKFTVESLFYTISVDQLHTQYHLEESYLDKYAWFRKLKNRHHNHHIDTSKNINLGFCITDKIMNTKQE